MIWFRKQKLRPPEEVHVPIVNFIGEQDGPPERELKQDLIAVFRKHGTVTSAYLARVNYGDSHEFNVALCIRQEDPTDGSVKVDAGIAFSKRFGSHEHLDIILIREDQEPPLRNVCKVFYEREMPTTGSSVP